MPKIKILPETLSNKIAAGEVVERPASVVKELLENALDAGSTRIMIEVEKGGRALIQVSDNGIGMSADDALVAIERHATSKISSIDDLFAIQTLGFRGEALPSIASVSRFALVTRDRSADVGTQIVVEGGKVVSVSEVGAPPGTLVSVKQLFFNTPARQKFLKTVATEMSHIADTVSRIALGHPQVQFRLVHNHKVVKSWPPASRHVDRIVEVLGKDVRADLHAIQSKRNGLAVSGWIGSPAVTRRTSRGLYVFVNDRFVRDRTIQHGIFAGFAQRLLKGQFPVAVIFIRIPFDQVDVNVHPTKNEVRFVNPQRVHEAVKGAIAQTLYETERINWRPPQEPDKSPQVLERLKPFTPANKDQLSAWQDQISQLETSFSEPSASSQQPVASSQKHQQPATSSQTHPQPEARIQEPLFDNKGFSALRVVGQVHGTYIVCESDAGLVLIDHHAAHERIVFEQLQRRAGDQPAAAQKLVVPETLELNFREADILAQMIPDLKTLGLEIEPFGKNSFVIKAVPGLLAGHDLKPLIVEIVEKAAETGFSPGLQETLDQCRRVMACHGSLRARQALNPEQIRQLLAQLDACEHPSHCPHGRPTWIRWDLAFLQKSFKRVVP
ncbi:MAG: DNA mismatch repair endonuclease MutL [Desulfobacterales bacterium]|jgi:DNA mismatch repair protein MutL